MSLEFNQGTLALSPGNSSNGISNGGISDSEAEENGKISPLSIESHSFPQQSSLPLATQKRMAERPKECAICARPANCHHFGVPSCLGCRSFFRRSVVCHRQYFCKANGKCAFGSNKKDPFCRSCRFERCLLAGMNIGVLRIVPPNLDLQNIGRDLERKRRELKKQREQKAQAKGQIEPHLPLRIDQADFNLLDSLLYLDEKLLRIRYSVTGMQNHFYSQKSMVDIFASENENILAFSDQFSPIQLASFGLEYFAQELAKGHHWVKQPNWLHIDAFLCLQMFRTMPSLQTLSLEDKISLMASNALSAVIFSQSFYSQTIQHSPDVLLFPTGFTPVCFRRNQILLKLFSEEMAPFERIRLTRPEFLLLRMLILMQIGSADLSPEGCRIVQKECENYSRALMLYERRRMGEFHWAKRYAELMFFVQSAMRAGHQHRSFLTYFIAIAQHNCGQVRQNHPDFFHPSFIETMILEIAGGK